MFGILDRYVGRSVLLAILLCTFMLVGLSALIKYVEQLKQVGDGSYTALLAGWYVILSMPRELVLFFPIGALLGGVIGLGQLASSSELVVLQSVGKSRFAIVLAVLKTVLPVMIIIVLMGEYLAPLTERRADDLKTMARSGGQMTVSSTGLWIREQHNFIHIDSVLRDGTLRDITLYRFSGHVAELEQTAHAESGRFENGAWVMDKVVRTWFNERERVRTENQAEERWQLALTPDKLDVVAVDPDELSISGLYEYISYLHDNGQKAERYELELWRKVVSPLSVVAMMLLAASTVFGPLRSVAMGARIVAGVILGFSFYVANEVFGPMSLVYNVPPLLGAIMPSLLFMGVAVWILRGHRA